MLIIVFIIIIIYVKRLAKPGCLSSFGTMQRTKCGCVVFRLAINLFSDSLNHMTYQFCLTYLSRTNCVIVKWRFRSLSYTQSAQNAADPVTIMRFKPRSANVIVGWRLRLSRRRPQTVYGLIAVNTVLSPYSQYMFAFSKSSLQFENRRATQLEPHKCISVKRY